MNNFISPASALLVLFLAGNAFLLSFEALEDLAVQAGVMEQKAWLYPAIIDGAIVAFSLSVLRASLNWERTVYPWALVSLFTLLSVVLNIIHAEQPLLAQFLTASPSVVSINNRCQSTCFKIRPVSVPTSELQVRPGTVPGVCSHAGAGPDPAT